MGNIIESVVECGSAYGVMALAILFLGLSVLGLIAYKTIQLVLPHLYKITCKCYYKKVEYILKGWDNYACYTR